MIDSRPDLFYIFLLWKSSDRAPFVVRYSVSSHNKDILRAQIFLSVTVFELDADIDVLPGRQVASESISTVTPTHEGLPG